MELDEIKKVWNEMDALKEKLKISDNRIKEMLKNEGKSALAKLIRIAKFYTIFPIPAGLFFCLCSYKFFEAGGYYMICPLAFLLICLLLDPLEIYLYHLLKRINYSSMTVKEVSDRILKYQNIVQKCQLYGMIVFVIFMGIWLYLYYKLCFGSEVIWWFIIYMIVLYLGGIIAIPFLFKKLYYKNINRIKENLRELKEFEES